MTLSPSDVEQKTFSTALRGYDLDEVDDFLDEVVATIRDLNERVAEQKRAAMVSSNQEGTPTSAPDESAVGRALVTAQETADQIVVEAREEAERILTEAREEADTLLQEKEERRAAAEAEMRELSEHVAGVRSQLAVLATAVADRLDEMDAALELEAAGAEDTEPDRQPDDDDAGDPTDDELEEFTLEEELDHQEEPETEGDSSSEEDTIA